MLPGRNLWLAYVRCWAFSRWRTSISAKPSRLSPRQRSGHAARSSPAASPMPQIVSRGGRLDQHPVTGTEQELPRPVVLAELGHSPGDHHLETARSPALFIESAYLAVQCLRCSTGVFRSK